MEKFYKAWDYLSTCEYFRTPIDTKLFKEFPDEKIYNSFGNGCLDINVVKVNPKTESIDDDDKKNTLVEICIETGDWDEEYNVWCHDYKLDCGGATFEEAIIMLAKLVKKHYK